MTDMNMADLLALGKETLSVFVTPLLVLIVWRLTSLETKTKDLAEKLETRTLDLAKTLTETTAKQMAILLQHVDKSNEQHGTLS